MRRFAIFFALLLGAASSSLAQGRFWTLSDCTALTCSASRTGFFCVDTDDVALYRCDGSSWVRTDVPLCETNPPTGSCPGNAVCQTRSASAWGIYGCGNDGSWYSVSGAGDGTGYDTVADEGTALTQRATLNFEGAGVSCVDDAANLRTTCSISGGGGGSLTCREADGTPSVSSVTTLTFDQADGFIVSEPVAGEARVDLGQVASAASADALAANGANCAAGSWASGVDASGAAEGCTPDDDSPDSDAEVPDVLTISSAGNVSWVALSAYPAACGATEFVRAIGDTLTCATDDTGTDSADDLSDNVLSDLSNVSSTAPATGQVLEWNGTAWAPGTDDTGAGGGIATVKESDVAVSTSASVLDFGAGFDVTEAPAGEVNVVLDRTEDPVDLASAEVTGVLPDANVSDALTIGSSSTITIPQSLTPTPTAEGSLEWDTDDDRLVVGTGAAQATFYSGAHTTDTDTTCLDAGVSCLFAGSASEGGAATTALALDSDPANCAAGSYPLGIAADGSVQSCTTDDDVPESGDFGAAADLDSTGALVADSVAAAEIASDAVGLDELADGADVPVAGECLKVAAGATSVEYAACATGGGSSSGATGAVQLSDGAGGFASDRDSDGTPEVVAGGAGTFTLDSGSGNVTELEGTAGANGSRFSIDPSGRSGLATPPIEVIEDVPPNVSTGAGETTLRVVGKRVRFWVDPYDYENLADPFNYGGAALYLEDRLDGTSFLFSPSEQTVGLELGADTDLTGDATPDRWDAINAAVARFVSELSVDNLASCDTIDSDASGVFSCGTDDDVPESGDFGAAADLDATGALLADSVGSAEVAADAVGASEIAAGAVGSSEIATDAVGAAEVAADAIGSSELATDSVGVDELNDGAATPTAGDCVKVAAGATSFEYGACGSGGGGSTILASWTLLDPASGVNALNLDAGGDTYLGPAADAASTVTKIVCAVDLGQTGESCSVDILEVTSAGVATKTEAAISATNTGATVTAIDDSALAAGNYLALDVNSCTGTISQLSCVVWGTIP